MTSIHQSVISEAIIQSACEVFSTMLAWELEGAVVSSEREPTSLSHGVVSLVGLAGDWVGSGCICCSTEMACKISSAFLMAEYTTVTDDVLDAMGEFTNMIIGNAKNELQNEIGEIGMSIPTVVFGRNFTTHSAGGSEWTVVTFGYQGDKIEVKIYLAPQQQRSSNRQAIEHDCMPVANALGI
jgi:chemotaxis protein CheX